MSALLPSPTIPCYGRQNKLWRDTNDHEFPPLQEWNYHSRQNAKQGHLIAERAKKDSGQMTTIARLGMIFLPGTFLAVRQGLLENRQT